MDDNGSGKEPDNQKRANIKERLRRAELRAQQKAAFILALKNGLSASQAAASVGISKPTGLAWRRKFMVEEGRKASDAARAVILQKHELAAIFSEIAEAKEESAAYRVAAGAALSKLQGYDAPARSEITQRVVPDSVVSWLADSDVIDVSHEPAQLDNAPPPKALRD